MNYYSFDRIKILVTSGCNLQCTHCYQHFEKNIFCLTKAQVLELVNFGIEHNVKKIDFSGGEFFVHPSAYEFIDYCYENNLEVNIATNGTCVNVGKFEKYDSLDFLTIQVSLDGLQENHEARRGEGSWDRVMQTVDELRAIGIKVTANMVLDCDNYLDALSILQLPQFSEVFFTPIAYVGAAANRASADNLAEYEEFVCQLMKEFVYDEDEFYKQIFPHVLAIRYDGGVYISPIASDYELLCLGNINSESIRDICDRYYDSNDFMVLRNIDLSFISKCNGCSASHICGRGNRLRALKFFGDIMAPDPFLCRIYLDEYKDIPIGKLFWGIR